MTFKDLAIGAYFIVKAEGDARTVYQKINYWAGLYGAVSVLFPNDSKVILLEMPAKLLSAMAT